MKARPFLRPILLSALLVAPALAFLSARADGDSSSTDGASSANATAAPADDARAASLAAQTYRLHPTDKIHIMVPDDPKAERTVTIAMDGYVRLAYLDDPIKLSGLTINDAIGLIQKTYVDEKIFIKPQVSLEVLSYADRRINVNGQVNRPGWVVIPPEETMTLVSAISAAGGPTRISDPDITITRTLPSGKTQVIHANLKSAMENPSKDLPIDDGDSIYVPEDVIGGAF
jgi:protein involved in polysaccharide export with SLBB domain